MMNPTCRVKQALFHITYTCEHNCPMCYANAGMSYEHPSLDNLCKIIDQLVKYEIYDVTLVGGDPALYPHIVDLARYAKDKGIILSILSNTLSFNGQRENILEYIDIFEGTVHHCVPQLHDAFCNIEGAYDNLISNLKYFSDNGKNIGIDINIIPYNYDRIYEMATSIIDFGVNLNHIVMQRIIQMGRASDALEYVLTNDMVGVALEQVDDLHNKYGIDIVFEDPIPLCAIKPKYRKYIRACDCGYTKMSIDPQGNIYRCGADVVHALGSIFQDVPLIWETNDSLIEFRKKKFLPKSCHDCSMYEQCQGGCPISIKPENGYSVDYLCIHNKERL